MLFNLVLHQILIKILKNYFILFKVNPKVVPNPSLLRTWSFVHAILQYAFTIDNPKPLPPLLTICFYQPYKTIKYVFLNVRLEFLFHYHLPQLISQVQYRINLIL